MSEDDSNCQKRVAYRIVNERDKSSDWKKSPCPGPLRSSREREKKMLKTFPPYEELRELIQLAKREDLGSGDVTSRLLVEENQIGVGTLIQKEVGIPCGLPMVEMICRTYDERLRVEQIPGFHMEIIEGGFSDAGTTPLLRIRGPMRSLLSAERVILNFLQHLSGVATQTH